MNIYIKNIHSTWPLFNLECFQLIRKPLEWTGHVSNILSYCKPCCIPEVHKFQIKKTTGYWFWKLLCNTSSLLPSLWEKISEWLSLHMGVVCKVLLPFSWGLLTPHLAQSTSTNILWCLFPFESQYCQTAIQIKHFGLALYLSFNIFLLFRILFLYTALLTREIFTQLYSYPLHAEYFVEVLKMNSLCSTDYISHMHFPPNVHGSIDAWIPISHSSTGSMTSIWAHSLKQANTGFFYAQEHNQRYCLYNGKWYGSYQWGYWVQITTTDPRILRNVYILNSLSNNAASYNMQCTVPCKFPTTRYSWQYFHFISDYLRSEVGISSLPRWTKPNWRQMHMDWSLKDP